MAKRILSLLVLYGIDFTTGITFSYIFFPGQRQRQKANGRLTPAKGSTNHILLARLRRELAIDSLWSSRMEEVPPLGMASFLGGIPSEHQPDWAMKGNRIKKKFRGSLETKQFGPRRPLRRAIHSLVPPGVKPRPASEFRNTPPDQGQRSLIFTSTTSLPQKLGPPREVRIQGTLVSCSLF